MLTLRLHASALLVALAALPAVAAAEESRSFEAWTLVCEDSGPVEARSCLIRTIAANAETKESVLGVAIGSGDRDQKLQMGIQTAPQVDAEAGVQFQIDSGEVYSAPYAGCTEQACILRFPLTDAMVKALKKGNTLTVAFTPAGSKEAVGAAVSLKGFTAALGAMAAHRPK